MTYDGLLEFINILNLTKLEDLSLYQNPFIYSIRDYTKLVRERCVNLVFLNKVNLKVMNPIQEIQTVDENFKPIDFPIDFSKLNQQILEAQHTPSQFGILIKNLYQLAQQMPSLDIKHISILEKNVNDVQQQIDQFNNLIILSIENQLSFSLEVIEIWLAFSLLKTRQCNYGIQFLKVLCSFVHNSEKFKHLAQ